MLLTAKAFSWGEARRIADLAESPYWTRELLSTRAGLWRRRRPEDLVANCNIPKHRVESLDSDGWYSLIVHVSECLKMARHDPDVVCGGVRVEEAMTPLFIHRRWIQHRSIILIESALGIVRWRAFGD